MRHIGGWKINWNWFVYFCSTFVQHWRDHSGGGDRGPDVCAPVPVSLWPAHVLTQQEDPWRVFFVAFWPKVLLFFRVETWSTEWVTRFRLPPCRDSTRSSSSSSSRTQLSVHHLSRPRIPHVTAYGFNKENNEHTNEQISGQRRRGRAFIIRWRREDAGSWTSVYLQPACTWTPRSVKTTALTPVPARVFQRKSIYWTCPK